MTKRVAMILLVWLGAISTAFALEPVYSDFFGKAIKGYDPVAYFSDAKPVKGSSDHRYDWNGATWYFSSNANLNMFIQDPQKFAPQYGGYCAWAVSEGYTASIDPEAWYIHDDKLYLNYSQSVQRTWQKDVTGNINKADANWPKLLVQ
nr:YHS domain-containing (seleno)protein [Vibrio fluminensis]